MRSYKILALMPATRQNLHFSATFPDEIRKLAASFMKSPATDIAARGFDIEALPHKRDQHCCQP